MEKMKNIYQRINAVMAEVDYLQKSDKKVAGQYRYVSHDMVTGLLHGPLTKHGIAVVPKVKEFKQDGNRTEMMVEVDFVNVDDPKDLFTVQYLGYGIDQADKGPGKAMSYACKYALLKVFCLETGDDPDNDQNVKHEPDTIISSEDVKMLLAEITKCDSGWSKKAMDGITTRFGTLAKMPAKHLDAFREEIAKNRKVENV
jgi:hypothetical protein